MATNGTNGNGTLRTFVSVAATILTIATGVIITYYSAEAGQNTRIALQEQRVELNNDRLEDTIEKLDKALEIQRSILDKHTTALQEMSTRQAILINEVEKLSRKIP